MDSSKAAGPDTLAAGPATDEPVRADGLPQPGAAETDALERRRRRRLAILLALLLVLAALLAVLTAWYLVHRRPITDILPPADLSTAPHYLYSIYDATAPIAVAVSGAGDRVYVSQEAGDRQVAIFDASGRELGDLQPPSDGRTHIPVYVTVDARDGDVYVADRASGAIYVYSGDGSFLRSFSPKIPIDGWQPLAIARAPNGSWWVTDVGQPEHRIEVFAPDGTLTTTIGAPGEFNFPNMIAFDAAGNAYVTDANNARLVVLDPTGRVVATVGRESEPAGLGLPRGIAIDDLGRLYVVDAVGQTVDLFRVGSTGSARPLFIAAFGGQGVGDGEFNYPNGVAVDSRDRVYVTDRENNRVQVWGY